jgi:transposase
VSPTFVSIIYRHWLQTGHVHPKQIGGHRRAFLEPYAALLAEQLSAHPSMTPKEVQAWLASEQGLSVSLSCVDKFLRQQLGYRYKKTVVASEQKREDIAMTREQWQAWQQSSDWSKLVFLDETGLSTDMIRRYGLALGGARCQDSAPADHIGRP